MENTISKVQANHINDVSGTNPSSNVKMREASADNKVVKIKNIVKQNSPKRKVVRQKTAAKAIPTSLEPISEAPVSNPLLNDNAQPVEVVNMNTESPLTPISSEQIDKLQESSSAPAMDISLNDATLNENIQREQFDNSPHPLSRGNKPTGKFLFHLK